MTKRLLPVLAAAATLLSAGRSGAADLVPVAVAAPSPSEPHFGVGFDLGLGSAVGLAGLTVTGAFGRFARLELGAGYGISGYQLSLMPKIALGNPHDHFVTGAGVSVAFPTTPGWAGHPVWLNVDALGYEHRFDSGIAVSATVGVSGGLGGGDVSSSILPCLAASDDPCGGNNLQPVSGLWFPQARIGAAYWF